MEDRTIGKHCYDGACAPEDDHHWNVTFSVGIFPWVEKKSGGAKKGKVVYRVYGDTDAPGTVYARARQVCEFLDAGGVLKKKSEWVK
jgi:hypothetical protein